MYNSSILTASEYYIISALTAAGVGVLKVETWVGCSECSAVVVTPRRCFRMLGNHLVVAVGVGEDE